VTAENAYNERVARVENQIIARLRDKLGTARNAHEMFRVFSKFNSLFVRPKVRPETRCLYLLLHGSPCHPAQIRGAIQGYQVQLIDSVKEDIKELHLKFTSSYRESEAFHMAQLRDIPPVAGAIIWARQIERQLDADMKRVEDVLGKGWELYAEGEKLEAESTSFRRKLNTQPIYEAWVQDTTRREPKLGGRLLDIVRQRNAAPTPSGQIPLEIAVNFDPQAIGLFKEVRNLLWLGFPVPHVITNFAKEAKRVYPFAVGLMESVRTYNQMAELVNRNPAISTLLADLRALALDLITRGTFPLSIQIRPTY
jgi:dynein heavy chain 1